MSSTLDHEHARRMIIIDAITAHLRHELRNRLSAVQNAAFYVRRRVEGTSAWSARVPEFVALIANEVARMNGLLGEPIAALEEALAHRETFDILDLARACVGRRGASAVRIEVVADAPLRVHAEGVLVDIAIDALIDNAIEASPPDGVVVIELSAVATGVRVSVRDGGPGIAEPRLPPAPLHSTKPGHLGVGLAIAHRVADLHGGRLGFDTDGTVARCVWIELPTSELPS